MMALSVHGHSLIGVFKESFPVKHGNYFSINSDDGNCYNVVNILHENILELMRIGIEFPYKINVINKHDCKICDDRIPNLWLL